MGSPLFGISHISASVTYTDIPDNEVPSRANDSGSTSAISMITWGTAPLPDE